MRGGRWCALFLLSTSCSVPTVSIVEGARDVGISDRLDGSLDVLTGDAAAQDASVFDVAWYDAGTSDGSGVGCVREGAVDPAAHVYAGAYHACAFRPGAGVLCWGLNIAGELGAESASGYVLIPRALSLLQGASVSLGNAATCGTASGVVSCQGSNSNGLFAAGYSDREFHAEPRVVPGLTGATSLAVLGPRPCAIGPSGEVLCWGGIGHPDPTSPTGVVGAGLPPTVVPEFGACRSITAGSLHRCALRCDGRVLCTGSNRSGECGQPPSDEVPSPTVVDGLDQVIDLVVGDGVSCALRADRSMWCWGSNGWSELGVTDRPSSWTPVAVPGLADVSSMAVSLSYTGGGTTVCAVNAGRLRCWGRALGVAEGPQTRVPAPAAVPGLTGAVARVALGRQFGVAISPGGEVYCWGEAGNCGRDPGPQALLLPQAVRVQFPD